MELIILFQWDCCGVIKFTDWNLNGQVVPGSCCDKDDNQSCTSPNELLIILQRDGCAVVFKEKIKDNAKIIGGVAIGFAIIEVSYYQGGLHLASPELHLGIY